MEYVYDGKLKNLPTTWKTKSGGTVSDFRNWEESNQEGLIAEGWLPVTKKQDYDNRVHGEVVIEVFDDHAEVTFAEKELSLIKEQMKMNFKRKGKNIYKGKWDLEYMTVGLYSEVEKVEADDDRDTLLNYYKQEVEPLIDNATTLQEIQDVSCTFPTI
jgi:hypothetical protein